MKSISLEDFTNEELKDVKAAREKDKDFITKKLRLYDTPEKKKIDFDKKGVKDGN